MTDGGIVPTFSTPDTRIFEHSTVETELEELPRLSDEQIYITYEISRTISEIKSGKWKRIALQFPDHMLPDAPRVFTALSRGLKQAHNTPSKVHQSASPNDERSSEVEALSQNMIKAHLSNETVVESDERRLFILADTSYGACCVDEVAAEHGDADVVVHYGRSCLSPTSRLPVIYIFTKPPLDIPAVLESFKSTFRSSDQKIILMADIPYATYLPELARSLRKEGYINLFQTEVVHNASSPLPNRTIPEDVSEDIEKLRSYSVFHISEPPSSLLLILASRVASMSIWSTASVGEVAVSSASTTSLSLLRRRYALLTSITTIPVFGILINTLSVKNYMHVLSHIKKLIAAAGKKGYTFVVGKVNAAKVANFAEVGGWVVIGCWESSLFDNREFWKPVITPFELELALQGDAERVWTGQWTSDFEFVLKAARGHSRDQEATVVPHRDIETASVTGNGDAFADEDLGSEEESEPPEFDLRTGRYVSHSRPMKPSAGLQQSFRQTASIHTSPSRASQSLIKRGNADLAVIGNEVSPAAEFFREKRSWKGLGSDYEIAYDDEPQHDERNGDVGAPMEEGRVGVARGYVVGKGTTRH